MFLNALKKQNPKLIDVAIQLHQQGDILPDTYVIDVDQFKKNAQMIKVLADSYNIKLYAMTKQFGRNPMLAKMLISMGYEGIVAVDYKEARTLKTHGINSSHLGHLVQIPQQLIAKSLDCKPQVITVYSLEKTLEISNVASKKNIIQDILLKFYQKDDLLYMNQESGFPLEEADSVIATIKNMPNIRIIGVTHFPCFLYDKEQGKTIETKNLISLGKAKKSLEVNGINVQQVNAPSSTCVETIPLLAKFNCTHGEPGHALTGTQPANEDGQCAEKIAILYLSEVSHHHQGRSYCYGGGYYRRGFLNNALIQQQGKKEHCQILAQDTSSIDYYLQLNGQYDISSPVIMCFRTQIFVTRSDVVLVEGISNGCARIIGLFDSLGNHIGDK